MKFQKIICLVMLILGALSAVYSFIYCSGGLAGLGSTISKREGVPVLRDTLPEAQIYLDVQPFNDTLLILSIVMILCAVVLYITATNKRRNYYASNYVAISLVCIVDIVISIYVLVQNGMFFVRYLGIIGDADVLKAYKAIAKGSAAVEYSTQIWPFVLGFVLYPIIIIACGFLVYNLVWKIRLMKGERALLKSGMIKEVA